MKYTHTDVKLEIHGRNEHYGEQCYPVGASKDSVIQEYGCYLVKIDNCKHGVDEEVFIPKSDLTLLIK